MQLTMEDYNMLGEVRITLSCKKTEIPQGRAAVNRFLDEVEKSAKESEHES